MPASSPLARELAGHGIQVVVAPLTKRGTLIWARARA